MIEKILKIKGIGRFGDLDSTTSGWDGALGKITVVYAENGRGKTTLTSIFRSLQSNDVTALKQRKSIGSTSSPEIKLEVDSLTISCLPLTTGWSAPYPQIEVFDSFFVDENIYSGLEISSEHKRELHKFIVGTQGVVLAQEIEKCKKDLIDKNQILRLVEGKINTLTGSRIPIVDFINLPQDTDIDQKITQKEKDILTTKADSIIQTKAKYSGLKNIDLPFSVGQVEKIFSSTVTTIQEQFLKIVEDHKKGFPDPERAEKWIHFGLENVRNDKCPFCLQDISGTLDILEAYRQYFNEEYELLGQEVSSFASKLNHFSIETLENSWSLVEATNNTLDEFWKLHVALPSRNLSITILVENAREQIRLLKTNINDKEKNPLRVLSCPEILELEKIILEINAEIDKYNLSINTTNNNIDRLRAAPVPSLSILENNLRKLQLQKTRYEVASIKVVDDFKAIQSDILNLNKVKDQKKIALDSYTSTVLSLYAPKINDYLVKLGTDFRIGSQVSGRYIGTATNPVAEYELVLDSKPVNFEDNGRDICVKHSLSEGDKNSLALAFFLARLELDSNLSQKIVIFDDPLSSHDEGRKKRTITYLFELVPKVNQLIVLTHNQFFGCSVDKELKKHNLHTQHKTITIFRGRSGSLIKEINFEKEFAGEYLATFDALENYVINGASSDDERRDIAGGIRLVIEGFLRMKFPHGLKKADNLGGMISVFKKIPLDPQFTSMTNRLNDLKDLNDYSKQYHHDNPTRSTFPINDTELGGFVAQALSFIKS